MGDMEASLTDFPAIPGPGAITIAEYGAQLIAFPAGPDSHVDALEFCEKLTDYHRIDASNWEPTFQHKIPSIHTANIGDSLLATSRHEGAIKQMWDTWRDAGWRGLQQYLACSEKNSVMTVLYGCLSVCSSFKNNIQQLRYKTRVLFFPHMGLQIDSVIEQAARVRDWKKSWIRAMSWHPDFSKLAIALQDDSVRICSVGNPIMPLLRYSDQKKVSCVAWRPCTALQVAVGVELGIVMWNLQTCNTVKPGGCRAKLITMPNHAPVTSLEYSRTGLLMVSSSSFDTSVYVWDVGTLEPTPLHRFGGGGVPLVVCSPRDNKILTTSPNTVFRIWDGEKKWAPRRWNTPRYPVEAACWNTDGTTLLFASGGMIYAIHFVVNVIDKFINQKDCVSVPVFDVSETGVPTEDNQLEYKVGGRVRQMDMDPSGNRLAVFFDDSELIAVFRVEPRSVYYLAPCGFIRGNPDEFPLAMQYQKNFVEGALLTIAWSSGRLQYVPFLFTHSESVKNLLHQDNYRVPTALRKSTDRKSVTVGSTTRKTPQKAGTEDEFFPSSSFRSNSFIEPPKSVDQEYEYFSTSPNEPLRLFSLDRSKGSL